MSITTVVCATDFSELATHAVHLGAQLAREHGASLTVLYVDQPPELSALGPSFEAVVADDLSEIRRTQDRFVEANLRTLVSELRPLYEIEVESAFARARAADGIVSYAAEAGADLLVVGHHGAGAHRLLLGSVAARVVRSTTVPTLVVPAAAPKDAVPGRRTLLAVPLESEPALALGKRALEITRPGSKLEVFHALYEPAFVSAGASVGLDTQITRLLETARETAEARLAQIAGELGADGVEIGHSLELGSPARSILARAKELDSDLIALGTHERRGLARVIGTTAERVLRHAEVPVLMVPAAA